MYTAASWSDHLRQLKQYLGFWEQHHSPDLSPFRLKHLEYREQPIFYLWRQTRGHVSGVRDETRYDVFEVSARIGNFESGDVDEEVALISLLFLIAVKKQVTSLNMTKTWAVMRYVKWVPNLCQNEICQMSSKPVPESSIDQLRDFQNQEQNKSSKVDNKMEVE